MRGLGKLVIVEHDAAYLTIYANLHAIDVAVDENIAAGAVLGRAGGGKNGAAVHFEIRKSTDALSISRLGWRNGSFIERVRKEE